MLTTPPQNALTKKNIKREMIMLSQTFGCDCSEIHMSAYDPDDFSQISSFITTRKIYYYIIRFRYKSRHVNFPNDRMNKIIALF